MLNRVVLIGRLTRDPELRFTQSGIAVASFTLAVLSTIQGLLPPNSRVTGVRCLAAWLITSFPTAWLPVKKI